MALYKVIRQQSTTILHPKTLLTISPYTTLMAKDIENFRENKREERKEDLIRESLRSRELTVQDTLSEGLRFSQFALEINRSEKDARGHK